MNDNAGMETDADKAETFIEGLDFYFENGLMVLTRLYLLNRGFCCEKGCRNCPYGFENQSRSE